jgi:propionyl-CoA carboxylase alpha chain
VSVVVRSPRAAQLGHFMPKKSEAKKTNKLIAPMAGRIVRVAVKQGETVKAGSELLVIEAMKMENLIKATYDVKIESVNVKEGDSVGSNQELLKFGA